MDSVFRVSLVLDMVDNMTSKVSGAANGVSPALSKLNNTFGVMQKAGAAMTGVGTAIEGACLATVTSTFDTQDALAEVASLGVEDLGALEKAAKSFSDTWAGTSKSDFISASYDIKSGIASLSDEGVAQFTELAALTAKATKSTAGEMTSLFATGYGIYKNYYNDLSDMEFGEMFSSGIATAVKNYKTSGSGMADAIKMLGASATNANVPMEEQLAILGQLQATMSGSEAGTKYKAFLNAAAKAGDTLGLSFLDANNQLLSMPEIMDALRSKYGDTIDAMEKKELKEAFGTDEAIALVDLLYNNTDQLRTGIDDLHDSMSKGTEATEQMAKAINDTPAQKFQVLKQQLHNATEELGQGLLPMANSGLEVITAWVKKGSDWIANNQETVSTIMRIVAIVGMFLIVAGGATATIGTFGKTLTGLKTALDVAKKATGGLSGALLSSPFTWVIAAIVAMIVIFRRCGGDVSALGGIFSNVFGAVTTIVGNVLRSIGEQLPGFLQFGIQLIGNIVQGIAQRLPGLLQTGISILLHILTGLLQMLPSIGAAAVSLLNLLVSTIVSGLPAMLSAGISLVQMVVTGLAQMLPSILSAGIGLLTQLLSGILQNLPRLMQTGMTLVTMLVQGLAQMLPTVVQTGIQMLLMLLSGILQNPPQLLQTGIALLSMFIQGVAQNLPTLLQTGISLIVMILQGILSAIPRILTAAIQLVPMLVQGIASNAPTLISSGISLIGQLLVGIIRAIPAILGMIPEMFGQIGTAITSIDWLGLGGTLVSSIKDGFVSGFTSLVDSVKGLWDDFVGWFKGDDGAGAVEDVVIEAQPVYGPQPQYTAPQTTTQTVNLTADWQVDNGDMEQKGQDAINALIDGMKTATPGAQSAAGQSTADIMAQFGMNGEPEAAAAGMMSDLTAGITAGAPGAEAAAGDAAADIMAQFDLDGTGAQASATDVMNDLMASITTGGAEAEGAAAATSQGILGAFNMDTSGAAAAGADLMNTVTQSITDGTAGASDAAASAGKDIMEAFNVDTSSASGAATEMINNLSSGISANAGSANSAATTAGQGVMDALNAGTATAQTSGTKVMTDMAGGIRTGSANTTNAMRTAATIAMNAWKNATASASSLGSDFMSRVRSGIQSGGYGVVSAAQGIANQIRSAFQNIRVTVPAPKLPHISVSYSTVGSGGATAQVPNFQTAYYAEGAILTKPRVFGMNGDTRMVGGEAGDEAILPLDTLWTRMRSVVTDAFRSQGGKKKEDNGRQTAKDLLRGAADRFQSITSVRTEKSESKEVQKDNGKKIVIQKLNMNVDISSMDDMNKLRKLIEQIEQSTNDDEPAYA